MALAPSRVHVGAARIFAGVTAGGTGTPPTYISHTAGVPGSGTEMGLTEGPATFRHGHTKQLIMAEQSLAPVDVYVEDETAEISCTLKETTYAALQRAFDNVGTSDISAGEGYYFGGGTAILSPRSETIMLTSRIRGAPTKFVIAVLYKAVQMDALEMPFSRAGESVYSVTFRGLADLTRNAGDQVGYLRYETAS